MTERSSEWIYVRDAESEVCWRGCDERDRMTMLACLSSDPRSLAEMAAAWARFRPEQTFHQCGWQREAVPVCGSKWLKLDLEHQCFSRHDTSEEAVPCGGLSFSSEDLTGQRALLWINVPPWWRELPAESWDQRVQAEPDAARTIDFRKVLFGRAMIEDIAQQILRKNWNGIRPHCPSEAWLDYIGDDSEDEREDECEDEAGDSCDMVTSRSGGVRSQAEPTARQRVAHERWCNAVKAIHRAWLMTPRVDLAGMKPRDFLHLDRPWKERELEQRRSQWSQERRPPPPLLRTSRLFLKGPMGPEEVLSYFDLCRDLIVAAFRWIDDDPRISKQTLVDELERFKDGWLESEAEDGEGSTNRDIIDAERALMPRLASNEPIDCDCALCRMMHGQPELFGPTFSMHDGFRVEMEDEFAFSLTSDFEEWENNRELWQTMDGAAPEFDDQSQLTIVSGQDRIWPHANARELSYEEGPDISPRLSLLCIGMRLTQIVDRLSALHADRNDIDEANEAFEQLGRAVGAWLVAQSSGLRTRPQQRTEAAAQRMIEALERIATRYEDVADTSADLQRLVDQWQRQLTVS